MGLGGGCACSLRSSSARDNAGLVCRPGPRGGWSSAAPCPARWGQLPRGQLRDQAVGLPGRHLATEPPGNRATRQPSHPANEPPGNRATRHRATPQPSGLGPWRRGDGGRHLAGLDDIPPGASARDGVAATASGHDPGPPTAAFRRAPYFGATPLLLIRKQGASAQSFEQQPPVFIREQGCCTADGSSVAAPPGNTPGAFREPA